MKSMENRETAKDLHHLVSTNHGNESFHLILDFHENASQDAAGIFHLSVH